MNSSFSEFDSDLSLDSLEFERNILSKSKSLCDTSSVPYYSGEVSLKDIEQFKYKDRNLQKSLNSRIPTCKKPFKSQSTCSSLRAVEQPNGQSSLAPTFTYFASEKASRDTNIQRISRATTTFPSDQIIRPRHKSVSYAEQFRRKISSTEKLKSATNSIGDSEPSKSLSLESCGIKDSCFETSEFEFFEDMLLQPQSTKIDIGLPQLNGALEESTSKSIRKTPMKKKENTVIVKEVDISKKHSGNKVIEKKSSIERREEYATKVKLRNKLNFNRQKDQEQKNKNFMNSFSPELIYEDKNINKNTPKDCHIPFTCPMSVLGKKSDKVKRKKSIRIKSEKQNKKPQVEDEDAKIEMLRKRHEQEKKLVNSLRQLIIKG